MVLKGAINAQDYTGAVNSLNIADPDGTIGEESFFDPKFTIEKYMQFPEFELKLNEKYNPKKFITFITDSKGVPTGMIPFYGITLTPTDNVRKLMQTLKSQEKQGLMNLVVYENLISQFNLQCKETYGYFQQGVYPIDFTNLKSICDDTFNSDKKIFQHLLDIDEKVFDFQRFASLKLFILTV